MAILVPINPQRLERNHFMFGFRLDSQNIFFPIDFHRYVKTCFQRILLCFFNKLILKTLILFCFELSDYHKNDPFNNFA